MKFNLWFVFFHRVARSQLVLFNEIALMNCIDVCILGRSFCFAGIMWSTSAVLYNVLFDLLENDHELLHHFHLNENYTIDHRNCVYELALECLGYSLKWKEKPN